MATSTDTFAQALQHWQSGQPAEAERLCQSLLAVDPAFGPAWHLLGHLAFEVGQDQAAQERLKRALLLNPQNAEAHNLLGGVIARQGDPARAAASFHRAVELLPDFTSAHLNLGHAYRALRQFDAAITSYRRVLDLAPSAGDVHASLGDVLADSRRFEEAIAAYRAALQYGPPRADVFNNLGTVQRTLGQQSDAAASFRQAIALEPALVEAHVNLGNVLRDLGHLNDAIHSYEQAIQQRPTFAPAYNNLANALRDQARLDEAIHCCRRALEIDPTLHRAHSNLVYTLYFSPRYAAVEILNEHLAWNQPHARAFAAHIRPHTNDRSPDRRLRIGYVSPDFCRHAQSLFTIPLLSNHDHRHFEIFCYSDVSNPDDHTAHLQSYADVWRDIGECPDDQVADQIRADEIDILVDLGMHMARGRLLVFARKPAPVQVCWLAYPGTTGLETMDYRLTDPHLDPGCDDAFYSERSIRLPDAFWCYDPLTAEPALNPLPALANGNITFGSLNNFCKVNDNLLRLWARVLRATPTSKLLLLAHEGSHRARTIAFLEREGIAANRLAFASLRPRDQYLRLFHQIDISLDTLPANGHTTSLDSLWMGVPVVTLLGNTAIGRGAVSILHNAGLPELIAHSPDEFVAIATNLATNQPRLSKLRQTLRQQLQNSPLMDAPRFARNFEAALRSMWRDWCARRA